MPDPKSNQSKIEYIPDAPVMRLLAVFCPAVFCLLPVLAAVATPEPPRELRAFYGDNPDYPRTFTSRQDVTLVWEKSATSDPVSWVILKKSTLQNAGIEELRAFARALEANPKRNRIKLGIEIGVFVGSRLRSGSPPGGMAGEESFRAQQHVFRKYTDPVDKGGAGGVIDILFMDGPIHRSVFPPGGNSPFTIATASEQVVRWMECFREIYPEIKYNLICNFSSWAYAGTPARNTRARARGADGFGDYDAVLDTLPPLAASRGVPFEGVTTDYAFDGFNNEGPTDQPELVRGRDFRSRLRALRDKVASLKLGPGGAPLRFGMLCNSSRGTNAGNYATRVELLNYLEEIHALGLVPDRITVQSWIKYPDRWLPETHKDSMTNITARILHRLRRQRDISADNTP
ncbi:MAG: hypothetical protein LBI02_01855 [Opitutaceae bacterium]|jgi:hypothetical protein|nr:hypothetical protein [Opitutaceae bacterium]